MDKKIPVTLITGFLGAGKTTAILHLLKQKPEHETWGVLVNEFGEIGIDGAMMKGKGAVVREVPGGCMCCVAGLPMQIGLNMLIARSKPDRILVEPTGLGHPKQILETLTGKYYKDILELKASICLLDPRNLQDDRYLENENFTSQVAIADVLVANKTDLCTEEDRQRFEDFCPQEAKSAWVSQGALDVEWLSLPRKSHEISASSAHPHHHDMPDTASLVLEPGQRFVRKENKGQGHVSCGWLFSGSTEFSFHALFQMCNGLNADRFKAVVKTDTGPKAFNAQNGLVSVLELDECDDSRIEIINDKPLPWDEVEQFLLDNLSK
ncbi:GTPase [Endozoicomonas montiporae]|uniref:GTPase n=2 Tax=Endozoicomonas montiporae TaxID=1027273 RepID=A0A081MZT1_9GAMM|nr:GTP-binding protein [Endozoicomonas montiporae]AMO54605.1 cobalamin synthesis protein [Endozoicomonas montiporae CL-33]KEQ11704.1 GTPase [Endozoicomonas montiporae]